MNEFYASFASFYPGQFASANVGQLHRLLHSETVLSQKGKGKFAKTTSPDGNRIETNKKARGNYIGKSALEISN